MKEAGKGKWVEKKFTSAVLTFSFLSLSKQNVNNSLFYFQRMSQRSTFLFLYELMANVRWQPATEMILWIREPALAYLHWFLTLRCACVGSGSQRCGEKKMTREGEDGLPVRSPPACLDTHILIEAAVTMTIWGNWTHMSLPCQTQYESLWTGARVYQCVWTCVSL